MPMIAIFVIVALVLTLTAPSAETKKPKTEPSPLSPPDDDPTDLLAQALDAYIKDKKRLRRE